MEKWKDVNDVLPWPHWKGEQVLGAVLVTVQLRNPDPNDDPEVMILDFDCMDSTFRVPVDGSPYETWNNSWIVTHWMHKPAPFLAQTS